MQQYFQGKTISVEDLLGKYQHINPEKTWLDTVPYMMFAALLLLSNAILLRAIALQKSFPKLNIHLN